jgi:hypothetical protein
MSYDTLSCDDIAAGFWWYKVLDQLGFLLYNLIGHPPG